MPAIQSQIFKACIETNRETDRNRFTNFLYKSQNGDMLNAYHVTYGEKAIRIDIKREVLFFSHQNQKRENIRQGNSMKA